MGSRQDEEPRPAERAVAGGPVASVRRRRGRRLILPVVISLAVLSLFALKLREAELAADRRIGVKLAEGMDVTVSAVAPEGPAGRAGVAVGDVLLAIDGYPLTRLPDYDLAAARFVRGAPATFRIARGDEVVELTVSPGMAVDWLSPLVAGAVMLCCLGLAAFTFYRSSGDLRGRLLGIFLFLMAVELALPETVIGKPWLDVAFSTFFYLLSGAQLGVDLHLCSVIPERQRWLARRWWVVPLYYTAGAVMGATIAATFLVDRLTAGDWLPWSFDQASLFFNDVQMPLWAAALLVLLGIPAWRYPDPQGRLQARLVLCGFLPWSLYIFSSNFLELFGWSVPEVVDSLFPLIVLFFPLSILAMMELESRSHRRILLSLTRDIRRRDSLEEIAALIARDLDAAFHPTSAYVFVHKEQTDELTLGHSTVASSPALAVPESFALLDVTARGDEPLLFPDELAPVLPPTETQWLAALGARVLVPINDCRRGLIGLLVLGDKRSEEAYSDHDFKLLQSLASQIAVSLENIGLQTRLHEKDRVQREVLARLQERDVNLVKECPECGACFDAVEERCAHDDAELALSVPVERTIAGRYRLDQLLGKGGIGSVYRARDLRLARRVAVKVLLGSVLDRPEVRLRFEREAQIIARLNHPNVVTVHDYGRTSLGTTFIVFEHLQGATLRTVLDRAGAVAPRDVAEWLEPILDGLEAAHRKGVVHRDLKPGNVLIARHTGGGSVVKLLDFGIAKVKSQTLGGEDLTAPGSLLGTLGYMAPEQVLGDDVDERADVYSVGVVVAEALLGRRPFQGRTALEVLRSICDLPVPLPGDAPAVVELGRVLGRCLRRDPEDRYASIAELRRRLLPALRAAPATPLLAGGARRADDLTVAIEPADPAVLGAPFTDPSEPTSSRGPGTGQRPRPRSRTPPP